MRGEEVILLNFPISHFLKSLAHSALTDGPKLEIGHSSCLTVLSPSVLYSVHGNDMSGQYGHG